ncbi:MAG TPA: hypothetical protein PKJ63_14155, partial [Cyclobacteriaceae bacterium]|nr:hypothetical protein [Cyclobacteriaceae bacterium]
MSAVILFLQKKFIAHERTHRELELIFEFNESELKFVFAASNNLCAQILLLQQRTNLVSFILCVF